MNLKNKKTWLIALVMSIIFVAGVTAGYYWGKITIPVEIKEPLEVVGQPTLIELYAGENKTFDVNITDYATVSYLVTMDFSLNDTTYQTSFVTFSNKSYTVIPGQNTLVAWMEVASDAETAMLLLTVDLSRAEPV